jgi:uncharacterized caspase-like protein
MDRYFRAPKQLLITAAVLALMTVATARARADGTPVDLHYVAVGVGKVPNLPKDAQLRFAQKDAQDLARAWDAQKGKLYANVQGELLTDENARRDDILAALDRLNERAKKGDTVVVSFAGHGGPYPVRGAYNWFFVAHDYDSSNFATALTEGMVRDRLAKLSDRGVTVILVIDTCFSGLFDAGNTGIIVLAACGPQESSLEDSRLENGLFTRALLEALSGKARVGEGGIITLEAVEEYVTQRVTQMVDEHPAFDPNGVRVTQRPTITRPAGLAQTALMGGMTQAPVTDAPQEQQRWRN